MKDGVFEVGDEVECETCVKAGVGLGSKGVVIKVCDHTWVTFDTKIPGSTSPTTHSTEHLKLIKSVGNSFNLKTQPWFIRTKTPEHRFVVQEWLFEQDIYWHSGGRKLMYGNFSCLTNVQSDGVVCNYVMHTGSPHPSAQEIKLTYKTTVNNVVYPNVESDRDKEIKAIRKEQGSLAARLKAL